MSNCFPAHDEHRNAEKTVMASTTAPSCLFPSSKTYGYEEPPCRRMTAETINKTQVNSESEEIRCLDGQLNNPKVQ